jgi:hypothetical protein
VKAGPGQSQRADARELASRGWTSREAALRRIRALRICDFCDIYCTTSGVQHRGHQLNTTSGGKRCEEGLVRTRESCCKAGRERPGRHASAAGWRQQAPLGKCTTCHLTTSGRHPIPILRCDLSCCCCCYYASKLSKLSDPRPGLSVLRAVLTFKLCCRVAVPALSRAKVSWMFRTTGKPDPSANWLLLL